MSLTGEIQTLYKDRQQTQPVFPMTKVKAVSDDDGTGLNVLLDAKAPAGFGLGENAGRYCADCHALGSGGLYYFDNNTANKPNGVTGTGSILVQSVVTIYGDYTRDIYVTLKSGVNIAHCYYSSYAGNWQPWEWENPPMIPGVEYRTTERWNGKVVYATLVNCGNLAETMTVNTGLDGSSSYIVSSEITMANMIADYFNPTTTTLEQWDFVGWTNLTQVFVRAGSSLVAGGGTVYATFKYVYR